MDIKSWDTIIIAAIAAVPATIASITATIYAVAAARQAKETHTAVDGQMDAFKQNMKELTSVKVDAASDKATLAEAAHGRDVAAALAAKPPV